MEGGAQAAFVALLASNGTFLGGLHALALEWRLTARLEERQGIDSVLTPLLLAALAVEEAPKTTRPLPSHGAGRGAVPLLSRQPPDAVAAWRIAARSVPHRACRAPPSCQRPSCADRDDAHSRAIIAERSLRLRFDAERGVSRCCAALPAKGLVRRISTRINWI
jgi:hypothetical protein